MELTYDIGIDDTTVIRLPAAHAGLSIVINPKKDSKWIIEQNPTQVIPIPEQK